MSITTKQFNELIQFETSSWALWSESYLEKDISRNSKISIAEYFEQNLEKLKPNIVLLGLNRSGKTTESNEAYPLCANFHGISHVGDRFLASTIMGLHNIRGAYMTDISTEIESDSSKVNVNHNEVFTNLKKQIKSIGSDVYYLICFGSKVFLAFNENKIHDVKHISSSKDVENFTITEEEKTYHFFKVIHYGYASRWNKKERFISQLVTINSIIK